MNPTNNGFANNDENLVEINNPDAAFDALTHVDSLFSRATLVTNEYLNDCMRSQLEKRRSNSLSRRR